MASEERWLIPRDRRREVKLEVVDMTVLAGVNTGWRNTKGVF